MESLPSVLRREERSWLKGEGDFSERLGKNEKFLISGDIFAKEMWMEMNA